MSTLGLWYSTYTERPVVWFWPWACPVMWPLLDTHKNLHHACSNDTGVTRMVHTDNAPTLKTKLNIIDEYCQRPLILYNSCLQERILTVVWLTAWYFSPVKTPWNSWFRLPRGWTGQQRIGTNLILDLNWGIIKLDRFCKHNRGIIKQPRENTCILYIEYVTFIW